MGQYIDKSALVAEIDRRIQFFTEESGNSHSDIVIALFGLKSFLDTLEVKESKLPNPRFPHLNNIIDKVFGTGNLESLEYEEAEQLVLLAKEELLKDLEVKEVNLEKTINDYFKDWKFDEELDIMVKPNNYSATFDDIKEVAKNFFELGLKAQKGE